MRNTHIVAALTVVAAAILSVACSNEASPPWEVPAAAAPAATAQATAIPVTPPSAPATATVAPSASISTAPVAEKELSVVGNYPRWELDTINFNPGTLNPGGGKITATVRTSDKEDPTVSAVVFKLIKPDGSTEDRPGASCGAETRSGVVSRCWEVSFDIPKNEGTVPQDYRVTSSSPSITDSRSGAFTLPVATASKSCTGIKVDFD